MTPSASILGLSALTRLDHRLRWRVEHVTFTRQGAHEGYRHRGAQGAVMERQMSAVKPQFVRGGRARVQES